MKASRSLLLTVALCFFIFAVLLFAGCADGSEHTDLDGATVPTTTGAPTALPSVPEEEKVSQQPETIYGVAPVDWVDSELSREYFPRLVTAYKSTITEQDNEKYGMEEFPFQLIAAEPFKEGALLFAGYTRDQDFPELYYVEGDKLFCAVGPEFFNLI